MLAADFPFDSSLHPAFELSFEQQDFSAFLAFLSLSLSLSSDFTMALDVNPETREAVAKLALPEKATRQSSAMIFFMMFKLYFKVKRINAHTNQLFSKKAILVIPPLTTSPNLTFILAVSGKRMSTRLPNLIKPNSPPWSALSPSRAYVIIRLAT